MSTMSTKQCCITWSLNSAGSFALRIKEIALNEMRNLGLKNNKSERNWSKRTGNGAKRKAHTDPVIYIYIYISKGF